MRILVVGPGHPWLIDEGAMLRFRACLAALASLGETTYVGLGPDADPPPAPPSDLHAVTSIGINWADEPASARTGSALSARLARVRRVVSPDGYRVEAGIAERLPGQTFDLSWVMGESTYNCIRGELGQIASRVVVDLND